MRDHDDHCSIIPKVDNTILLLYEFIILRLLCRALAGTRRYGENIISAANTH